MCIRDRDSWVIPANAENKENAEKWIDFMCRPDIAKRNFEYIDVYMRQAIYLPFIALLPPRMMLFKN